MMEPGQHVVVGLSGGADSTCLLVVLDALREEHGCSLSAVHVHHGLRESADRDEAFCQELCALRGIPLTVVHADAAEYAATYGMSVEEAGRTIRYEAFRKELACHTSVTRDGESLSQNTIRSITQSTVQAAPLIAGGYIATAHHREDLAETVLFNLCRGSGIAGLAGIQPMTGNIIRPLLYVSREEIEAYLRHQGIAWCEDETNLDIEITRNYLRREILPGLTSYVNAGTTDHLVRLAGEAAETQRYLAEQTAMALERCQGVDDHLRQNSVLELAIHGAQPEHVGTSDPARACGQEAAPEQAETVISMQRFHKEPRLLQRRILHQMITQAAGRSKDIAAAHVEAVMTICESSDGTASVDLPYGLTAIRTYDILTIRSKDIAGETDADGETGTYRMHVFCRAEGQSIPAEQYTKWFDYDRIGAFPTLRTRTEGDVITIGGGVVKSLRRFMIDDKIPRQIRDQIQIPFAGNQALWIPGHQMNAAFKVTDETSRILEITYIS